MDAAEYKHVALGLIFLKYIAPHTTLRGSALFKREAKPQVASKAKDNMVGFLLANCVSASCFGYEEGPFTL